MRRVKYLIAMLTAVLMIFAFCACGGGGSGTAGKAGDGDREDQTGGEPIKGDEIAELYTNPDAFAGRTYEFTAKAWDIGKDGKTLYLTVYQDIKNFDNTTVVIYENADIKVKSDDYVRVEGVVEGAFEGTDNYVSGLDEPAVKASKVEVIDVVDAFPADKTVEVDKTETHGDFKATLKKVDYTDEEMRIYLTVENNSDAEFSNYPDQGALVLGGKQYEPSYSGDYPYPITDVKAGASVDDIIVFEGLEPGDFTYSFNGYDDDYNEIEFSFDVKVE